MDHSVSKEQIARQIIEIGLTLTERQLVVGSWGNISVKMADNLIAVTPSGRDYNLLEAEDIVYVDAEGNNISGKLLPSSELLLHLAIYRTYPAFKAIIHTHSIYASACAVMHKPIPAMLEDTAQIAGGPIRVAKYAPSGTEQLAVNAVKALAESNAVLLANHGAVCCGCSLREALNVASIVEKAAHIYCITKGVGEAFPLPEHDIISLRAFYLEHYRKRQEGLIENDENTDQER